MPQRYNLRPAFFRTSSSPEIYSGFASLSNGDIYTSVAGMRVELVAGARPALVPHERVTFRKAIDLYPTDRIEAGEKGVVSHTDLETGTTYIVMELMHFGLEGNALALSPHIDDDALASIIADIQALRYG